MSDSKAGPLTVEDLIAVWTAAVDPSYGQAFITAGEGGGFEAYTQGFAQSARVSLAIDVSTQAQYILPSSGMTDVPAMGAQLATVSLTISRSGFLDRPMVLGAGLVYFGEVQNDWSPSGPIPIQTGRLYTLQQDLVFLPGDSGPFTVTAIAAGPGWGYNNPQIGTISVIQQTGTQFYNDLASVTVATGAVTPNPPPPPITVSIISQPLPDTFVPEHIGQYVAFTAGANNGIISRITMFAPPNPPVAGSTVQIEDFVAFEAYGTVTGSFTLGEQVEIKNGSTIVGWGMLKAFRPGISGHTKFGLVLTTGTIAVGDSLLGQASGATVTISLVHTDPAYTAEAPVADVGGASWRILDWVIDFGLTVTNLAQPSGGRLGYLDGIGFDRDIPRLPGEPDTAYRLRIWQIADVVTPNAIIRSLNRMLGAIPFCFREVGTRPLLPGFFYDGNNLTAAQANNTFTPDAYDYDVLLFSGSAVGNFVTWPISGALGATYTGGFQEPVQYCDSSGNVKAYGYFGRIDVGVSGDTLTMIRKGGQGSLFFPVEVAAGDFIKGLVSGAEWFVSANIPVQTPTTYRFHYYLDYADFRAMFLVGLPRVDYGEFGFFWGALPHGSPGFAYSAYDSTPYLTFYDGFPAGASAFYMSVYNQLERIKAGGVSIYLYPEDGSCS